MKTKPFVLLTALTVLAAGAAMWSTVERGRATASSAPPASLFPNLVDQVNDITRINIHTPKLAFTIRRKAGDKWQVEERDGYPVQFATIKQAVVGIAQMRLLEAKTAKPALHHKLFLKAPKDGGRGTAITLGNDGNETVAAIIVGKTKVAPTENDDGIYYVRRQQDAQTYLASGRVEVLESINGWLDSSMPMIARKRVRAATTIQPDGSKVGVFRTDPDARDFKIADIPPGKKSMGDTIGNSLGSALGFLSFEDVRRADKIDFAKAHQAVFKTFDGVTLKLLVLKRKDGNWLHVTASFDAADIKLDGLTEKQKKTMKSADEAKAEVAEINQRYSPWAYILPEYKAKDFMTAADDLMIEDKDSSKE